jgi:hypothetical protein
MNTLHLLKLTIVSLLVVVSLSALPLASASASGFNVLKQACSGGQATSSAACSGQTTTDPLTGPNGLIGKVTKLIALFAGIVAVIVMIIGGFMYVLSGGDSGKVSLAKDTLVYAAVGLVVIVLGQAIIVFVINRL